MPRTATAKRAQESAPTVSVSTALPTAEQVMEHLGVSRTMLWSLMRKSGLPYIKLGPGRRASLRFSLESVDIWLKQNEQRSPR